MKNNTVKLILVFTLIMGAFSLVIMLSASVREKNNTYITINTDTMELVQLQEPKDGDPIAVVDTTLGEFRFVLYPEYSPNAVKNFVELAESGYYNNTYVFHSDSGAYSAAGAPSKDGTVTDVSHELTERELNQNLWPFKGAVCAMNTTVDKGIKEYLFGGGTYYNGSRFAILNTIEFTDELVEELRTASESEALAEAFIKLGGIPNFSQQMTVIGQIYSGIEVAEQLSNLETLNSGVYKIPKDDIMIISVTIGEYSSEDIDETGNS